MKTIKSLIIIFVWILITSFSFWSSSFWFTNLWGDNLWFFFDLFKKIVEYAYLILRPLMIISWKFLSNNFVYGSSFGIDNVLWQLWQVVRVFSNYMIWFIFIASIFIYFFKADSNLSWKKNLPRVAISAIFINMSWFLIAVLIDISTVLTLAAWSIWSTFSSTIPQKDSQNVNMMVPLTIDTDSTGNFVSIVWTNVKEYHSCIKDKDNKILNSPCFAFKDSKFVILDKDWKEDETLTKNIWWANTKKIAWDNVWMLVSLFRYMNGAFLIDNTNNSVNWFFLEAVKLLLLIVLIVPFIILTIILVVRVIILWVVIPLSPFILWAYILWIFDSQIKKRFKDIITLIFQPAYIVFMLSIWFVFIQSIQSMIPNNKKDNKLETLWIYSDWEPKKDWDKLVKTVNIWENWLFTIQSEYNKKKWTNDNPSDYKNILYYISWIIANLLSAFVLWSLVYIAFKSNSITERIADPIQTYTKTWLKTAPILPWWQSVASLEQTLWDIWRIPQQKVTEQAGKLTDDFKKKKDNKNN